MADKVFTYKHSVYFNETNSMRGVVYFSHFVKWQGMVREEFFLKAVPEWKTLMQDVMNGNLNMITVEEHSRFIHHAFFGDEIMIRIHASEIRKLSFKIIFEMTKNNKTDLIYTGWQKLAFDDCKGNFVPIPDYLLKSVLDYTPAPEIRNYQALYEPTGPDPLIGAR